MAAHPRGVLAHLRDGVDGSQAPPAIPRTRDAGRTIGGIATGGQIEQGALPCPAVRPPPTTEGVFLPMHRRIARRRVLAGAITIVALALIAVGAAVTAHPAAAYTTL